MKRIVSMLLLLALVLGLCACSGSGESVKTDEYGLPQLSKLGDYDLYAGFGRRIMTPLEPIGLGGYSNAENRVYTTILDDLYVTSIALTDAQGDTVILMNWDAVRSYTGVQDGVRNMVSAKTGVPRDRVFLGGTHTHSAPDMNESGPEVERYINYCVEQATLSAMDAMADRRPANVSAGSIEAEGLNFVRHYMTTLDDGTVSYFGDNFGTASYNETTAHTSEADPTMHMVYFDTNTDQDMCLINWRAHPHFTGGSSTYDLSSDWCGAFREAFEYMSGVQMLYFNGAAGNINEKSRVGTENKTLNYKEHGRLLADYAIELIDKNLEEVDVDQIRTAQTIYKGNPNHTQTHLLGMAAVFNATYSSTKSTAQAREATGGLVRSRFHASAIVSNSKRATMQERELNVILLGKDIAMTTAPNELFDTNTVWLEENSPVKYNLTLGYTNGHHGYVPSAYAWQYTSYETDITSTEPGTGEKFQECLLGMIKQLLAE